MTWTAFDSMATSLSVIAVCAVVTVLQVLGFYRWVWRQYDKWKWDRYDRQHKINKYGAKK
jgi:hypothetical protein